VLNTTALLQHMKM